MNARMRLEQADRCCSLAHLFSGVRVVCLFDFSFKVFSRFYFVFFVNCFGL